MRRLVLSLAVLIACLAAAATPVLTQSSETEEQSFVEGLVSRMLSAEGRTLAVRDVSVGITGNVSIAHIEVRDETGTWMTLDGATLDWQPFSLMGDTLRITELRAERIAVERLPEELPEAEAPEEGENLGGVVAEKLSIGELAIGAGVFGSALSVSAEGKLEITQDPRQVLVTLAARHTDGSPGEIDAEISYDQTSRVLAVDLTANEQRGGALSALLPVAEDADVGLTVSGSGPIDDWSGTLAFTADGQALVDGQAHILRDGDGFLLGLEVAGAFDTLTPEGLDELFAGRSELSLRARYEAGVPMRIDQATLRSAAVEVSASGTLDTEGSETSLDISARTLVSEPVTIALDAVPFGALDLTDAEMTGEARGDAWSFDARARSVATRDATVEDLHAAAHGTGLRPAPDQPSDISATVDGTLIATTEGAIPPVFEGALSATADLRLTETEIEVSAFTATSPHAELSAKGKYGRETAAFELAVNLDADRLETGNTALDGLLTGQVKLSGSVSGTSIEKLVFEDLSLTSDVLEARIDGTYDSAGASTLMAAARIASLDALNASLGGSLTIDAKLEGPFNAIAVDLTGRGEGVTLDGRRLEGLQLTATGELQDTYPDLVVRLDAMLDQKAVVLDARVRGDEDAPLRLDDIDGRVGPASLTGALALTSAGAIEGTLDLAVADLSAIDDPAFEDLDGSVKAHLELASDAGVTVADVRLEASDLARDDIRVDWLTARLRVSDLLGKAQLSGSGLAQGVGTGATGRQNLAFDLESAGDDDYRIELREAGGKWSVRTTLAVESSDAATLVHVRALNGALGSIELRLADPTTVRMADDGIVLEPMRIVAGGGSLTLAGAVSPELGLRAELDRLPLALVNTVTPDAGLGGAVSGTIATAGTLSAPVADFSLRGAEVSAAALREQGVSSVSLEMDGTLRDDVLRLNGRMRGAEVTLTISGTVALSGGQRVDMEIAGTLPSAVLARLGAERGIVVHGTAQVNMRLGGTVDELTYSGVISTSGATVGDASGRLSLRNVEARVVLQGQTATIERFTGTTAGGSGQVAASGTVGLQDGGQINLNIRVDKGRYVDGTLLVTLLDANLNLRGAPGSALQLTGTVDLYKPKVTLNEPLPEALASVRVEHRGATPEVRRQQQALRRAQEPGLAGDLIVDIEIRAVDDIVVTGRGINAELTGGLRLTGRLDSLSAYGSFRLRRGSVDLPGRKVELSSGELLFTGDLNPFLRFAGTVRTSTATITLAITGPADTPEVTISSVPDLPQEEALALLIFGRPIGELSPIQVAQMAGSVALLSGGGGGGLSDSLQQMLGSTTIEVVRTEDGETAVNVGRRITDQLSVGVQQETETGKRRVIIDLDITDNLILRGTVGDDRSTSTGIFFEKEY